MRRNRLIAQGCRSFWLIASGFWLIGCLVCALLARWNLEEVRRDAQARLLAEAARSASQLAGLVVREERIQVEADLAAAADALMEDDLACAVRLQTTRGLDRGLRRDYLWEPVPWDGDVSENCVQGMALLTGDDRTLGSVTVWLSDRLLAEEDSATVRREWFRFGCFFVLWTLAFLTAAWGVASLGRNVEIHEDKKHVGEGWPRPAISSTPTVDAQEARNYQQAHPEAWQVTAGMFRQTFARGPALLRNLYDRGQISELCHLGDLLQQAAPLVGAGRLAQAARMMQGEFMAGQGRRATVENCAHCLEEVLATLCGKGQWRSGKNASGS